MYNTACSIRKLLSNVPICSLFAIVFSRIIRNPIMKTNYAVVDPNSVSIDKGFLNKDHHRINNFAIQSQILKEYL